MPRILNIIFVLVVIFSTQGITTIINVPGDYSTLQAGMNACEIGDTVLAQPMVFYTYIDFDGRDIVVGSLFIMTGDTSYISSTIIDAYGAETAVEFGDGAGRGAVLSGFTIRNGDGTWGGGIRVRDSDPTISYNIITGNFSNSGAGINISGSNALVSHNKIIGNHASNDGGGVSCGDDSALFVYNIIQGNTAESNGGGFYCRYSRYAFLGNIICDNIADHEGGGFYCYESDITLRNNVICGNYAIWGGGLWFRYSNPTIENNTFYGNSVQYSGGAIFSRSDLRIINSILWADTAGGSEEIHMSNATCFVTYSNVQGGWEGVGNLDVDPLFRDPANGDFHLQDSINCGDPSYSPCIDAGTPNVIDTLIDCSWGMGTTRSDMGAYGGGYAIPGATIIVPDDYPTIQDAVDASYDGDSIVVMPGVYEENIVFHGHNSVLGSFFLISGDTSYVSSTIIDGSLSGSVVTFEDNENASAVVTGFTIQNGHYDDGGGIYCDGANPTIDNNIILGNNGIECGGGIYCVNQAHPEISNNTIRGNCSQWGGGIHCDLGCSPTISGNSILENITSVSGGGIFCHTLADPIISYNLIAGNNVTHPSSGGGGIYCWISSNPVIINNTITGNHVQGSGGGIFCNMANPIITNTIIWADSAQNGVEVFNNNGSPVITYSDIQGSWEGEGNIDNDPLFVDPESGDYHLMAGSPCIDAGDPNSPLDPDGTVTDIGAFYFDQLGIWGGGDDPVPSAFQLMPCYPNPFNPITTLEFAVPIASRVNLVVYDVMGRKVVTLVDGWCDVRTYNALFNGSGMASGIYFARMQARDFHQVQKMVLLK